MKISKHDSTAKAVYVAMYEASYNSCFGEKVVVGYFPDKNQAMKMARKAEDKHYSKYEEKGWIGYREPGRSRQYRTPHGEM